MKRNCTETKQAAYSSNTLTKIVSNDRRQQPNQQHNTVSPSNLKSDPQKQSQFNSTELKHLLEQDIKDLDSLEQVLTSEKIALQERDTPEIESTSKNKASLIQQIEARAKQKAKLLATSGLKIKPGQVTPALVSLGDTQLLNLWKESVVKLKQCKEHNEINGTIISHSLSRTSKLMSIVRGQSNKPNLYGQQGKTQSYSNTQVLGKA